MSETLQLLFPGCSSQSVEDSARNEKPCSSATAHFLTSLAVAIVIGIGVALAAHFLAHSAIEWTAVAGGGAALVSGIITYIILRCVFGRISQSDQVASTASVGSSARGASTGSSARGQSEIHKSKKKTANEGNLFPKWLSKLLPQNLARISFDVGEKVCFETLREKMTTPIAFLEGDTSAIVLDLLVKHTDHNPSYVPGGRNLEGDIPSSSNFHMLIVIANNGGNGKWRLIPEKMDIRHRTVIYSTRYIFPDDRSNITYFFDPTANPKIPVTQEEEPEDNKLHWLLSRLLTNQTVKIPEFEIGTIATDKRAGTWEINIAPPGNNS